MCRTGIFVEKPKVEGQYSVEDCFCWCYGVRNLNSETAYVDNFSNDADMRQ